MKSFFITLIVLPGALSLYAQDITGNFSPPVIPLQIHATRTFENIMIDGKLNEPAWQQAIVTTDFFRMEPRQGGSFLYKTFVRVLFDKKNLYFGFFCKDTLGKKGMRVQDYRRDFDYPDNDIIGIQLDPQNLKRYCMSFQTTPLGNQSDQQVFDDQLRDQDWDALWKVRTVITDSGYYTEFAIPFHTLRYNKIPAGDTASFGITFFRLARRDYEQTVFPAIPQSFSPYRMKYAAQLGGLQLPPPSVNLRLLPYALFQKSKSINASGNVVTKNQFKAGGDIKWAVNPHGILDLTFNTDFAQADVDQAVNNLTRFNVFFPEKRQFFLENNGVYAGTNDNDIEPFFTRTIGLSNAQYNADPVPIDGGLRYTDKTIKRTFAGLYIHQRSTDYQAAANFGVLRYLKNYGAENNVGIMLTHKLDESDHAKGFQQNNNTTLTVDGFTRIKNTITIQYLASTSRNNTSDSIGYAGYIKANYSTNKWYLFANVKTVSEKYLPAMGFVFQNNVTRFNIGGYRTWRPKKNVLGFIRRWDPGLFLSTYHNSNNFKFQSAELDIFPVWIFTPGNGLISLDIYPTWEQVYFTPLGIQVKPGKYFYTQWNPGYTTDASKKLSGRLGAQFGNYYDGKKSEANASIRIAPVPNIALTGSYQYIRIRNLGIDKVNQDLSLITIGARLALNPRVQASVFYQYNSYDKQARWNARGSWEFAPLSFLYLVFNDNSFKDLPVKNQSFISKVSYLKQF